MPTMLQQENQAVELFGSVVSSAVPAWQLGRTNALTSNSKGNEIFFDILCNPFITILLKTEILIVITDYHCI